MYSWQFSSVRERPQGWYAIALIVVLFFVVYGIYEGVYLMSIVAFLFAGVYILMENNGTPITTVTVDEKYIAVDTTQYDYANIEKFTLLSSDNTFVMLRLFVKKSLVPMVDIPLTGVVDPYELRDFLAARISYDAELDWQKSDRIIHAMGL